MRDRLPACGDRRAIPRRLPRSAGPGPRASQAFASSRASALPGVLEPGATAQQVLEEPLHQQGGRPVVDFPEREATLRAPDISNAWVKPTNPSPPASRPSAVSQAERHELGLQVPAALDPPDREPPVEDGLVLQLLLERVRQSGLGQDHGRADGDRLVDPAVCGQVDESEATELAGSGHAVDLGLIRVGPEQDLRRPTVNSEEPGERLDILPVPSSRSSFSPPLRADERARSRRRSSATATGAGSGAGSTPSLPGARSRRNVRPYSPYFDDDRLAALQSNLEVVLLVDRPAVDGPRTRPRVSGRVSRHTSPGTPRQSVGRGRAAAGRWTRPAHINRVAEREQAHVPIGPG